MMRRLAPRVRVTEISRWSLGGVTSRKPRDDSPGLLRSIRATAIAALTSLMPSSLAHSAGPAISPISQPDGSTISVVGMPKALPASFELLKHLGALVGIIGQVGDAGVFQEGERLFRIAGIDIDRHHLEFVAAELGLQLVERRHFLAAGHAPGGPEVQKHGAAAPVGELALMPLCILEGRDREPGKARARRPAPRPRRAPKARAGCAAATARRTPRRRSRRIASPAVPSRIPRPAPPKCRFRPHSAASNGAAAARGWWADSADGSVMNGKTSAADAS